MNYFVIAVYVVGFVVSSTAPAEQPSVAPSSLVFTNVTVIDATGAPAQPDMTVIIENDRIQAVGETDATPIAQGPSVKIIDASGKFLIPGLWDMHTHLAYPKALPGGRDSFLPMLIALGITGVRDMGGDLDLLVQWREEISAGKLIGPRIIASGPMLDGPNPPFPESIGIPDPTEARRVVQELKQQGADFIKVQSLIPREAYFAVLEEARRQDMAVAGHVPNKVTAAEVAEGGQRSIEHSFGLLRGSSTEEAALTNELTVVDLYLSAKKAVLQRVLNSYSPQKAKTLFARIASSGTWYCPTFVWIRGAWHLDENSFPKDPRLQYIPPETFRTWGEMKERRMKDRSDEDIAMGKEFFRRQFELTQSLHEAGVRFLAGTDTPVPYTFPGYSLHEELVLLVEAGLTPLEALQAATRNPAEYFEQLDQLGTVEAGKLADLVLLDANPIADIRNTQKISAVVVAGKLYSHDALQALLAGAATAAQQE